MLCKYLFTFVADKDDDEADDSDNQPKFDQNTMPGWSEFHFLRVWYLHKIPVSKIKRVQSFMSRRATRNF